MRERRKMNRKTVSGMMLTLLLIGTLTLAFNVQSVKAVGTIYIRPDGSIDPSTAPIARDGDIYTLTNNIFSDADGIVIERDNMTLDGAGHTVQGSGSRMGIYLSGRNNVTIRNMEIKAFYDGVLLLEDSSGNNISGNSVTGNRRLGVLVDDSFNNSISRNSISNNELGIRLQYSSHNILSANNITKNELEGIYLHSSLNNTLRSNRMAWNKRNFGVSSWVGVGGFVNDVDVSNTVDDKPIIYWINKRDMTVPVDAGYVALIDCTRITIQNLNLTNNAHGVLLVSTTNSTITENDMVSNYVGYGIFSWFSSFNTISGNSIKHNNYGIYLWDCSNHNSISENNITDNRYGIYLWSSSKSNTFCHNNLIDNIVQVRSTYGALNIWDDGYPSGGNYWSDYEERYPDAIELDGSGLWDTPYFIDENNQDNYPLMEPWTPLPRTINELKTEIEELGSEGEIDNQGIVRSLIAKLNVAQKLIDNGKTDQAKKILNAFINEVQAQSEKHISPDAAELLIESAEHILSHL